MELDQQAKAMRKVNSRLGSFRPELSARSAILKRPRVLTFKGLRQAARGEKEAMMHSSTYLSWFRRLLILGAVVAGLTASAAGAQITPGVNGGLRWQWEHQMHSPATASQRPRTPRYYGSRAPYAPTVGRDQPLPPYYGSTSPYAAQELNVKAASTGNSNGFDWNDYAIGIATGLGVALVLVAALLVGRHQRHRPQPA